MNKSKLLNRALIFDLDGTLVNTIEPIVQYVNVVRSNNGLPDRNTGDLKKLVGLNPMEFFNDLDLEAEFINTLVLEFRNLLNSHPFTEADVYKGVLEKLHEIKSIGFELAIATNKPTQNAILLMEKTELSDFFSVIQGSEGLRPKPYPDIILKCVSCMNVVPNLFIGDRKEDVLAGKGARVPSAGLLHSGTPAQDFIDAEAECIFEDTNTALEYIINSCF